jgi:hypothetical protein
VALLVLQGGLHLCARWKDVSSTALAVEADG